MLKRSLLIPLLLILSSTTFAADSSHTPDIKNDEQLPIEITADSLDVKAQAGTSLYQGKVIIQQGTTHITGDQVTLFHPNQAFEKANITGAPATFKRFLAEEQSWLNGHADQIIYNSQNKTLELIGHAFINQEGKNAISAPRIFYNLATKSLVANGDQPQQRIKMILTPDNSNKTVD